MVAGAKVEMLERSILIFFLIFKEFP